ncbi:MAG: calcium-binding protein, partial [Sphingobium sp.]
MAKTGGTNMGRGNSASQPPVAKAVPSASMPAEAGAEAKPGEATAAKFAAAKVVELGGDDKALLGMAYAPFKVEIVDVDLVLVFQDGSRIIIPGMAMAAFTGRKPILVFSDKEISADQAVATVGEIKEQNVPIKLMLSSASSDTASDTKADGQKDNSAGGIQPGDSAKTQAAAAEKAETKHKYDQEAKVLTEKISNTASSSSSSGSPGVISAKAVEPAPDDAIGPAGIGKLVPKLTFTLFNSEGVTTTSENGRAVIKGDTGAQTSSKNASFAAQSAKEVITGSSASDIIYADGTAHAPTGQTFRTLHVEAMVPAKGLQLTQLLIPSLPAGYSIANATLTDKGWLVNVDTGGNIAKIGQLHDAQGNATNVPASQSAFSFDLQLIYTLPTHGSDGTSAFLEEFFLPVQLGLSTDGKNSTNAVEVSTHFGIKVVNEAGDMIVTNPVTGDPIYVLYANPPGNIINAGAGNDHIYAGAGEDQIDGGTGTDIVDYSQSNLGVTADLGTGTGTAGYAKGDTYTNVEGLVGSAHDDILIGNAQDNSFDGGAGADRIDGGAGFDTVDYSKALNGAPTGTSGVEIFLDGSASHGGQAEGDRLTAIEHVIGTARNDILHGGSGSETLEGGAGNDLFTGSAGADTLDGGADFDTVDYSQSAQGVTAYLDGRSGVGGDAAGDVLRNIEKIIGSAHDDSLTGDAGDNILRGGAGADRIDGGAGVDTVDFSDSGVGVSLYLDGRASHGGDAEGDTYANMEIAIGSTHDDRLVGAAGAESLYGGEGNDILEGGAGADLLDGGAGQDIASYAGSDRGVRVSLDGSLQDGGDPAGDRFVSIEGLEGSRFDDTLIGGALNDTLIGGDGDDILLGLGGADRIDGGAGFDTVDYSASFEGVKV